MLDAFGQPQSAVVLGGTSDLAGAIVDALVRRHCKTVVLAGRDEARLASASRAAGDAGADHVATVRFDALDVADATRAVDECFDAAGPVDLVLLAVGVLSSERDELDAARTADVVTATYSWPAVALTRAASRLREQGYGRIVVLSSVAAVRVRRQNFVYASAKAGLDAFAIGLSEALRGSGVVVQVVRPGRVPTKMTAGLPKAPLSTTPEAVARVVVDGLESGAQVVWAPPLARWALLVARAVPQAIWRRLPG
ncbi:MAG TPA: SDR family NAD(P)-dependent oxidoreductase [Acidimicrobiales bacterium]|nr:SDR family NAD(P)-dependent oxidoreductase [Acidimicrobiales bacterium]